VNDFKCWYNVGAEHEQVVPLNTDADVVDFLNVIEMYKFEVVHLYVEHMMDHVVMINETFLLEYCQTQVGEGGGRVDEVHTASHEHEDGGVDEVHTADHKHGDGGVDEVHTVGHEHGDGVVDEVQMAGREDEDGVNTNE
jgi:hypothetical protein